MEEQTDLFGIPVPSTDKIFLTFIVIHIMIAFVSVVSGLLAMLSDKGSKRHNTYGKIYFWTMACAFCTVVILAIMRWPHNTHLLVIGSLAIAISLAGYRIAKVKMKNWTRLHTVYMGSSYILLLTGFYVDNGKNLPFWNQFSQWVFYVFPSAIGVPIIVYVLLKHPLNRSH